MKYQGRRRRKRKSKKKKKEEENTPTKNMRRTKDQENSVGCFNEPEVSIDGLWESRAIKPISGREEERQPVSKMFEN